MTGKQEDKITMWTTVDSVLTKYTDDWSTLPGFKNAAEKFRKIRFEVDPQAAVQITALKGLTDSKSDTRRKLTNLAAQMANNIAAYAMDIKDIVLEEQFTFAPSYFDKLRDNLLPVIVNAIINKAAGLLPAVEPFGITQSSIGQLTDAFNAYNNTNAAPRTAVGERKTAGVNIVAKLHEGMHQLEIMDKLVGNFSTTNPDFVSAYQNARMIIHLGTRTKKDAPKPTTGN